jgi:hypothetical protein
MTQLLDGPTDDPLTPLTDRPPPRVGLLVVAVLAVVTAAAAGYAGFRWADRDGRAPTAACEEARVDGPEAVAVSRSVGAASPGLTGIVDATARFHEAHPEHRLAQAPVRTYLDVVVNLAARPELATPGLVTALEHAAGVGGMAGVHALVANRDLALPGGDGDALSELRSTVSRPQALEPGGGCRSA